MTHSLEDRARLFATAAHAAVGQKRKYTDDDYIVHPESVANHVRSIPHTEEMLAAAWLHDVVEDTNVPLSLIREEFGYKVADLVSDLTDVSKPEDGNRAVRKAIDREHTAQASPEAKTIKLADLIDNTRSIVQHDKKFAKVYLQEKTLLMPELIGGDFHLFTIAVRLLVEATENITEKEVA